MITLGSPLQMDPGDRSAASLLADRLQSRFDPTFGGVAEHRLGALPVPSTSIYSRTDGVVRWQVCLDVRDDRHENVEVLGSHVGLGFNASALFVVADRLAQAEGTWRPFQAAARPRPRVSAGRQLAARRPPSPPPRAASRRERYFRCALRRGGGFHARSAASNAFLTSASTRNASTSDSS